MRQGFGGKFGADHVFLGFELMNNTPGHRISPADFSARLTVKIGSNSKRRKVNLNLSSSMRV